MSSSTMTEGTKSSPRGLTECSEDGLAAGQISAIITEITRSGVRMNRFSSSMLVTPPGCPPRMDWILRVSGPCYIGQKHNAYVP